jgi:hypothetical protein
MGITIIAERCSVSRHDSPPARGLFRGNKGGALNREDRGDERR